MHLPKESVPGTLKPRNNNMDDKEMLDQLAAEMNGHEITDDNGQVNETAPVETTTEETSTPEIEQPEETAKPVEQETVETNHEAVEDESGKRYVPEDRFKKIYAERKALERELETYKKSNLTTPKEPINLPKGVKAPDKADILELKMTLPQFDPRPDEYGNPTNTEYSPELDKLAGDIYKGNPGITPLRAAQQALSIARELSKSSAVAKTEARIVKSLQSDRGITGANSVNRSTEPDLSKMSDKELELYLKKTGQW